MKAPRPPTLPRADSASPGTAKPPPVVGIGASAGGLKALQLLVEAIPADSGFAYVVILHLDPLRESRMSHLLQDRAAIPVTQLNAPAAIEANRIYVIPPDHDLAMNERILELHKRGERAGHAPVDLFFRTLADSCGPNAVGVILSGTGADGTAGIRHIREAGGITIAQAPDEAEYDGMPVSAIASGLIDLVIPAAQIPAQLIRFRQHALQLGDGPAGTPNGKAALAQIFATLRNRTGHDFTLYKRSTVLRRLERRLRFNSVATLPEYHAVLQETGTEPQALLRDLLISVSGFFRDPAAFEDLAEQLPTIFEGKDASDAVRVWVVGCATGEEVYSIAMLLSEHAATLSEPPRLQLFATDIDESAYAGARAGLYSESAIAAVPPRRLQRFFTQEPGGYRISKSIRELVLFAGHNVLHDPPFSRMDMISCRNLFIYLQPEAQERVLETFHFASNPNGLLFLGASESVGDSSLFTAIPKNPSSLFRRNSSPYRVLPRISAADPPPRSAQNTPGGSVPAPGFSYGATHLRMLELYAAASVIINERMDVVHMSADAGRFLRLGAGEPNHNLLGLAREDLRRALRTDVHKAFEAGTATARRVEMNIDGIMQQVEVHVRPSREAGGARQFALIVFDIVGRKSTLPAAPPDAGDDHQEREANELHEELRRTRDLLESTSLAHDRSVAELHAVNEELRSINEEQRAATEELETGREEIQAINEELTTINQEHQSTIEELKRTNGDLQNLIESTEIGTIFLDRAMRVRRFTPVVTKLFNFVPSDRGRLLSDITHRLNYPELSDDIAHVLQTLERSERQVDDGNGGYYIARINPYHSVEGASEGAVLTFIPNTAQHRTSQALREATVIAESANAAKSTFLSTLSHELRTPLNSILGYADLLEIGQPLSPEQRRKVERIRAASWHLVAMINEILSFAKLDGGHEAVVAEQIDACMVAREAAVLIEPAAMEKSLEIIVDTPETPLIIATDANKVRQILLNLAGNAIKYTQTGQIRLSVSPVGNRVRFTVADTGIGIPAEYLDKIFERFWQVNGGSTRTAGGMGIGLSAAREYARLLQGEVEVESTLGQGTTFRFWLPLVYDAG